MWEYFEGLSGRELVGLVGGGCGLLALVVSFIGWPVGALFGHNTVQEAAWIACIGLGSTLAGLVILLEGALIESVFCAGCALVLAAVPASVIGGWRVAVFIAVVGLVLAISATLLILRKTAKPEGSR